MQAGWLAGGQAGRLGLSRHVYHASRSTYTHTHTRKNIQWCLLTDRCMCVRRSSRGLQVTQRYCVTFLVIQPLTYTPFVGSRSCKEDLCDFKPWLDNACWKDKKKWNFVNFMLNFRNFYYPALIEGGKKRRRIGTVFVGLHAAGRGGRSPNKILMFLRIAYRTII